MKLYIHTICRPYRALIFLALFPSRVENTSVILRIKQLSPIFGPWLFYFSDYITMLPVIDAEITGNIFLQILLQFQFNLLFAFSQLWCNNYPYGEQSYFLCSINPKLRSDGSFRVFAPLGLANCFILPFRQLFLNLFPVRYFSDRFKCWNLMILFHEKILRFFSHFFLKCHRHRLIFFCSVIN